MAKTYSRPSKAPQAHQKFVEKVKKAESRGTKMPKMSRREMLIMWYESKGYKVVPGRSSKFVTMEHPGKELKMFIGKNGSLQSGKNISSAGWALTDMIKWPVLEKWCRERR